ncbi:TELO2-interacting protein 1 homolog [Chanos chanos]|uniref:TELO2-interacting protein 1 homolog n=1 Tax=Chanos chanos TaxID=29144 RepID=A0A6J2WF57_CHACN|nr:TELO2-interacting protein 1 homolog [Chanos chanos]
MHMEQIDDPKIAFAFLRPSCVLLTQEPTVSNVKALRENLHSVSDGALQQLQDYVLFPLRFVLKTPGSKREGLIQGVMEAMAYVLENTCIRSWESLRDLFSELCLSICSPTDPGQPAPVSEELKTAVLRCLDALLHSAYGDIIFQLYEPTMLPGLGAAISLLLALAEHERARGVQEAALKCLLSLLLQCDCPKEHVAVGQDQRYVLGDAFASFLPGITRALSHVISGDVRQGHAVTVKAMRMWSRTVGLVMEDDQLQTKRAKPKVASELGRIGELIVHRTSSWSKATAKRLNLVLQKIISCTSAHRHWRVRLELVNLSDQLLTKCNNSLGECIGPLMEALVGAVNDEDLTVRERCSLVLKEIAQRNQTTGGQAFIDVLSENLHTLASSLPRLMRTTDDQRKLFLLNVFLGYLKILGPQVEVVLSSAAHLQRISRGLMQVLELDVMDVRIVEERSAVTHVDLRPELYNTRSQRKHFLYFTDDRIFSVLGKICRTLGYYGNLYLLVDHFMDLYKESSVYRKQSALVLNDIIAGATGTGVEVFTDRHSGINQEDLMSVIQSIIEEYISVNNWQLSTVTDESNSEPKDKLNQSHVLPVCNNLERDKLQLVLEAKCTTVHQLNSNIWQICIQLEGIGTFALVLGSDFRSVLMTTLYPVLEKAGDDSLLVSQSALCTLNDLCQACAYSSPKELIIANSDYLLNDVSLNLGRPSVHPHAPRVLAVMFSHSDASLLPLVIDVVQDVLVALDLSYDQRAPLFCAVLHTLLKAMVQWFPTHNGQKKLPAGVSVEPQTNFSVKQFLVDYCRQKELAEGIGADEEDPNDSDIPPSPSCREENIDGPDMKPELPSHVTIAKDIMERCIHFLSDPSLRIRLKVLDMLELCVCVLSEKQDELLPMVHRCWSALLQRLINDDPLVIPRAFRVLCTLGKTCGDFLRKRVSKEVLPKLTASLAKQARISAKAGPTYAHTVAFKVQLAVLEGLGPLCVWLDLVDSDLDSVLEACLLYLSCRQPAKLQDASLSVFQNLMEVDPDACWFALNELYCPASFEPPHPDLQPVELCGQGQPRNEYTDNVLKLLSFISGESPSI